MNSFLLKGKSENKIPMEKYMRNQFSFLGVRAPDRKIQSKELLKTSKQLDKKTLIQLVDNLYQRKKENISMLLSNFVW